MVGQMQAQRGGPGKGWRGGVPGGGRALFLHRRALRATMNEQAARANLNPWSRTRSTNSQVPGCWPKRRVSASESHARALHVPTQAPLVAASVSAATVWRTFHFLLPQLEDRVREGRRRVTARGERLGGAPAREEQGAGAVRRRRRARSRRARRKPQASTDS